MTSNGPSPNAIKKISEYLSVIFGDAEARDVLKQLEQILKEHQDLGGSDGDWMGPLTERDVVLICYGDQVQRDGERPLQTLGTFLTRRLSGLISTIHILPFFPYSSDDGFSVIDYASVNPDLGTWEDVHQVSQNFRLMVDAVINHISSQSKWFQGFLQGDPDREDFFIKVDPNTDLSMVVRPRDLPLLTRFETHAGTQHIWTTFSEDQIDLNFANPKVLLEILEILLLYVRQGAQIIRLDAIAFLWKKIGSPSIHLRETHAIVKLLRTAISAIAPWVLLITETNVPHDENISYFGDGTDEAHMVYQFALPPLVLHTFLKGDSSALSSWASQLELPSNQTTFFNFLASHDGIGLRPAHDLLSLDEVEELIQVTEARGGGVSYRSTESGERTPYELNITYLDALTDPTEYEVDQDRVVARFLASQSIMLSLAGLPAIYFHSLVGSQNDLVGLARSGKRRSINREKLDLLHLERELANKRSLRSRIYTGYSAMLALRATHPAFNPYCAQEVFTHDPSTFSVLRTSMDGQQQVLCVHEISGQPVRYEPATHVGSSQFAWDLMTGEKLKLDDLRMAPYQVRWLSFERPKE